MLSVASVDMKIAAKARKIRHSICMHCANILFAAFIELFFRDLALKKQIVGVLKG